VLTLVSAAGVVAGADSVCNEVIEDGWQATYPEYLADTTTPERLAAGYDWLRRRVSRMPRGERGTAVGRLEGRVQMYREVTSLGNVVESIATGVAMTPALVDLLPSDISRRADSPMDVGWTLASGEHAELQHALAQRLGDMPPEERGAALRMFKMNIARADSMQMEPHGGR
jgi:hypothetical protein